MIRILTVMIGCVFFVFACGGCAQFQVSQRQQEIKAQMDPLIGKSKSTVILSLGTPREIVQIEGMEVYKYYQSFGIRSQAAVAPNPYLVSGNAKSWEAYDTINVYFRNGTMVKWDSYVQR